VVTKNKQPDATFVELTPPPDDFDPSEIEDLIKEVDDLPLHHSLLVYGKSGVGKSRLGASNMGRTLIINCNERKPVSIYGMGAKILTIRKVPDDTEKAFWYLRNGGYKNFDWVVVDSLSALQKMYERHVVKEESDKDKNKHKIIVSQRDYGIVNNYMFIDIMNIRNLQEVMNVMFIALEREPDEKVDTFRPDITPGTLNVITSAVDIVGRMHHREVVVKGKEMVVPTLWVGPHAEFLTKETTYTLGTEVLKPTLPKIIKRIEEGYAKRKTE